MIYHCRYELFACFWKDLPASHKMWSDHRDFELRLGYETHTFDISQTCLRAVQLLAEKNIPG